MQADNTHESPGPHTPGRRHAQARPRVLVVEADDVARTLLVGALEALGIDIDVAVTGTAGLQSVREHQPSVIIVAAFLPCMDAIAFVEASRLMPGNRGTPVVVMASTEELLRVRKPLHALGGVAVLTEPFQFDALRSIVLPLTRRARGHRRA